MTTAAGYRFSLPFDEPVEQLEDQIAALRALPDADRMVEELTQLETGRDAMLRKIYSSLSAWDTGSGFASPFASANSGLHQDDLPRLPRVARRSPVW